MDFSTLYWILVLPNLGTAIGVVSSLLSIALIIYGFISIGFSDDNLYYTEASERPKVIAQRKSKGGKFIKWSALPILIGMLSTLIPTDKQMMYMIGGYVVTNVQGIEKLPNNVIGAANKFLEDFNVKDKK